MAILRYTASADTTITNAFKAYNVSSTRATGSNMGASDILETFSIYARRNSSNGYTSELSRILLKFPTNINALTELCKSEILNGKESLNSLETIEDIKLSIPQDLSAVLENYSCDISNWQHAKFIYENGKWGDSIVLVREELDSEIQGKFLTIVSHNRFKIETFLESL